ncbi:hypothetical protein PR202_gb06722 [Eleusine coracana subsp. coracana]|uniref:Uncharacterized protein n=1 Tax=Eleusine coracana subsp. coracana TaxID=191504 RepID=A0AAV5E9K5_ELECO|nr:hypothetical protein PR202_gb06722 [Eleusine coracana subsp. coracana]
MARGKRGRTMTHAMDNAESGALRRARAARGQGEQTTSHASQQRWLGKTNFVEARSFWHLFRSFDRMWTVLVLGLQVLIIMAWHGLESPLQLLDPIIFEDVLSIFITNAVLRVIQVILDIAFSWRTKRTMRFNLKSNAGAILAVWAPIILVFFMDTQIWYSVFCTIFGGMCGIIHHLGEIRTMGMVCKENLLFCQRDGFDDNAYVTRAQFGVYSVATVFTCQKELRHEVTILLQDIVDILIQDMIVDARRILDVINSSERLISNDDGAFEYYEPELFASVSSKSNIRFPFPDSGPLREQVKRLYFLLNTKEKVVEIPSNLEARRRISFFATSLFMDMPAAPKVRNMLSFR